MSANAGTDDKSDTQLRCDCRMTAPWCKNPQASQAGGGAPEARRIIALLMHRHADVGPHHKRAVNACILMSGIMGPFWSSVQQQRLRKQVETEPHEDPSHSGL